MHRLIGFVQHNPDPWQHPPPEAFLTDGGHIDNSGAFPLLKRKCGCIIAVDSDLTRECSSIYILWELSRRKLDCAWHVNKNETACVDVEDYMLDFRLPRARFVGCGEGPELDPVALLERERQARRLMVGEVPQAERTGKDTALAHLVSHVRTREDHVYLYFMSDADVETAFVEFPYIRNNFKIAQSLEGTKKLKSSDYLESDVMRKETLRHAAHFRVVYSNGSCGDFFFLRGETSPNDLEEVRAYLKPYEPSPTPWTTIGAYPGHSTLGEGFTWPHVDKYAEFSKISMSYAWKRGAREKVLKVQHDAEVSAEEEKNFFAEEEKNIFADSDNEDTPAIDEK